MSDYGIDYGLGQANVDKSSGIRYGIISSHALNEWALDSFEADYGDPTCPSCGTAVVEYDDEAHGEYDGRMCDYACEECQRLYDSGECYGEEPLSHTLDDGTYHATMDTYNDIFVLKSPYYTYAQFCSPCAPGACHLENPVEPLEGHPKAYCFGHDWFDGNVAPYPVYQVSDDALIESKEE